MAYSGPSSRAKLKVSSMRGELPENLGFSDSHQILCSFHNYPNKVDIILYRCDAEKSIDFFPKITQQDRDTNSGALVSNPGLFLPS